MDTIISLVIDQLKVGILGRFKDFILCRGEHLTLITDLFLTELLLDVGLEGIRIHSSEIPGYPAIISEDALSFVSNIFFSIIIFGTNDALKG